jgi:hypothetical protein
MGCAVAVVHVVSVCIEGYHHWQGITVDLSPHVGGVDQLHFIPFDDALVSGVFEVIISRLGMGDIDDLLRSKAASADECDSHFR